jgi:hypothetical protein
MVVGQATLARQGSVDKQGFRQAAKTFFVFLLLAARPAAE